MKENLDPKTLKEKKELAQKIKKEQIDEEKKSLDEKVKNGEELTD